MKCILIHLIVFINVVSSDLGKRLLLPQLPVGEYRVNFLGIFRCDLIQSKEKIKINYYLYKTSANTSEIRGNLTTSVPLDDSLNFEIDMAVKDSIGGWKENAHIFKTPKACSSIKSFFGDAYTQVANSLGMNITHCPIPAGIYTCTGLSTNGHLISNFPKKFFYGTYKLRTRYTKNNEVYGCGINVIEVKRPWETD